MDSKEFGQQTDWRLPIHFEQSSAMPSTSESTRRSSASQSSRRAPSRLENVRVGINQLFTGRSRVGLPRSQTPESPKTPRVALGLQNLPSTRINIPYLHRTSSQSSNRSTQPSTSVSPSAHNPLTPFSSRPITPRALRQETRDSIDSTNTTLPPPFRRSSTRRFIGVDPAELHLAELAHAGRRRRRQKARNRHTDRRCAPKIKNRKIRQKILSCFVSGLVSYQVSWGNGTRLMISSFSHSY